MLFRKWVSGGLAWIFFLQSAVSFVPVQRQVAQAAAPEATDLSRTASDPDPYFLGSQSWGARAEAGALAIEIPETDLVLNVRQPLVALGQAGDWAFFAPKTGSALDESGSQGLYFLRVRELYQSARARVSVPFFYLPLPAQESEYAASEALSPSVLALVEQESILISDNQGVAFAVPNEDILGYEKNATAAMQVVGFSTQEKQLAWLESSAGQKALAPLRDRLWNEALGSQQVDHSGLQAFAQGVTQEILHIVPQTLRGERLPAGSTRFHGLLPTLPLVGTQEASSGVKGWGARLRDGLRDGLLPSAWAADSQALELAARTAWVVSNCSLFFTAGVLLKHTLLKSRVAHVQLFVLGTAAANTTLILDEVIHGIQTVGLEGRDLRKLKKILDQTQKALPELKLKRDAQIKVTLARESGPSAQRAVEGILREWTLLEERLAQAQALVPQAEQIASQIPSAQSDAARRCRKEFMGNLGDFKSNLSKASGSALEFKTNVGIFGHVLTLIAQIPAVWGTHTLRYIMDRLGIAEHRGIRQLFFEKTFGFAQRTSDKTPINDTTVKQGTLVLNGIDTGNVGVQLYGFNPWFARVAGAASPSKWLREKILEAFGTDNATTANYNMITLVGNLVSYIAVGAYTVAHDQQEILTQLYDREVKRELKDRGIDVESADGAALLNQEVRRRVRAGLLMRGFPTEEEFLFDANSTYAKMRSTQGYEVPAGTKSVDHAQSRPGRVREVLEAAIKRAGWQVDPVVQNGLQEIEQELSLTHALKGIASAALSPSQFFSELERIKAAYRQARKDMVALTIQESPQQDADVIVNAVAARFGGDRDAALRAWDLVREEWERVLDPSRAKREKEELLRERADAQFLAKEKKRIDKEMNPELRIDAFGRWQVSRAQEKADLAGEQGTPEWEKAFRAALVAASGLNVDYGPAYKELLDLVEKRVAESWTERLANKEFADYYHAQAAAAQRKLRILYQAEFFASAYSDLTINKKVVPAISPAQPGLLQALRQKAWISNSRPLTYAARFLEGAFSNGRYQLGFWPQIYRTVPLFEDAFVLGATRSMRRFPVALTFGLPWSYAIWATAYAPSMFVLNFVVSAVTVAGPWSMVTRMMDNMGVKQGSSTSGMALFATVGSWATMWGMLLTPIVAPAVLPVLKPVDDAFERTGFLVKKVNPETQETRLVVRPHPGLELCRDLLRPVIDGKPAGQPKPPSQQVVDGELAPKK